MNFFLALFFLSIQAVSASEICGESISREEMVELVHRVKDQYYPELKNTEVLVRDFQSNSYFLQTYIKKSTIFRSPEKRTYGIEVNTKIYECSPGNRGLTAILIHEFKHIQDYFHMNSAEIIALGLKYITNLKFKTRYERHTDVATLEAGHAEGLKEFRDWIYQWLSPKELAKKKRYYYTPTEIDIWTSEHTHRIIL